jgi:hypothetical protein
VLFRRERVLRPPAGGEQAAVGPQPER